jgi:hypothetical protein
MHMPEATVHIHDDAEGRQDDVRTPGKTRGMKSKPIPEPVKKPPDDKLGCRVLSTDAGHHPGPNGWGYDVNQSR